MALTNRPFVTHGALEVRLGEAEAPTPTEVKKVRSATAGSFQEQIDNLTLTGVTWYNVVTSTNVLDAILGAPPAAGTTIFTTPAQASAGDCNIPVSRSVPAGVTLKCAQGRPITIAPGALLTISGIIEAGPYPIFIWERYTLTLGYCLGYQTTPPSVSAVGDRYLVKTVGTGAWAGHDNEVATWGGAIWTFAAPDPNDALHVAREGNNYKWAGGAWVPEGKVSFGGTAAGAMPEQEILIRWFSTAGDGVANDTDFLRKAAGCVGPLGSLPAVIKGTPGDTYLNDGLIFNHSGWRRVVFDGCWSTFKLNGAVTGMVLDNVTAIRQWHVTGSDQVAYKGTAIGSLTTGCYLNVKEVRARYLDRVIDVAYAIYGIVDDIEFDYILNGGIRVVQGAPAPRNPNVLTLRRIKGSAEAGRAIDVTGANVLVIDRASVEGCGLQAIYLDDCTSAWILSPYLESNTLLGTAPAQLHFKNCEEVLVTGPGHMAGNAGTAKSSYYFEGTCRNIITEGLDIYNDGGDGVTYASDGSGLHENVLFRNCKLGQRFTNDLIPFARWEGNTPFNGNMVSFALPAGMVKNGGHLGIPEYAGPQQTFASPLSAAGIVTVSNASVIGDPTAGYDDGYSAKCTFTGTPNYVRIYNICDDPGAGTYVRVLGFWMKADTDMAVQVKAKGPDSIGYFGVKGDSVWRFYCIVNAAHATYINGLEIVSDSGSGNLWVDTINSKIFNTVGEAVAWAGHCDLVRKPVSGTLAVDSTTPSVAAASLVGSIYQTANTVAKSIERLLYGRDGMRIPVRLADINSKITSLGTPQHLYSWSSSLLWSANKAGTGAAWDYFPDAAQVNDCIYLGSTTDRFAGCRITVGTAFAAGSATFEWRYPKTNGTMGVLATQYWTGSAWADASDILTKAPGTYWVFWAVPEDWADALLAPGTAVRAMWVQLILTAVDTPTEGGVNGNSPWKPRFICTPVTGGAPVDIGPPTGPLNIMVDLIRQHGVWFVNSVSPQ